MIALSSLMRSADGAADARAACHPASLDDLFVINRLGLLFPLNQPCSGSAVLASSAVNPLVWREFGSKARRVDGAGASSKNVKSPDRRLVSVSFLQDQTDTALFCFRLPFRIRRPPKLKTRVRFFLTNVRGLIRAQRSHPICAVSPPIMTLLLLLWREKIYWINALYLLVVWLSHPWPSEIPACIL